MEKYRIVEVINRFWAKRWALQEKYHYYENGKLVENWHNVIVGERKHCEEALQRRIALCR